MAKASYVLRQPHRFDGQARAVGESVDLHEQLGDWLVGQGVLTRTSATSSVPAAAARGSAVIRPPQWRAAIASRCCGR